MNRRTISLFLCNPINAWVRAAPGASARPLLQVAICPSSCAPRKTSQYGCVAGTTRNGWTPHALVARAAEVFEAETPLACLSSQEA